MWIKTKSGVEVITEILKKNGFDVNSDVEEVNTFLNENVRKIEVPWFGHECDYQEFMMGI